jgi:hypothetical protein
MPRLPGIARIVKVGSWSVQTGRVRRYRRLDAVTMELGRDETLIQAEAHADGKLRLAFGSGEEFEGYSQNLPVKIGAAARGLLAAAAPFVGSLPKSGSGDAHGWGTVRFALHTPGAVYAEELRVSDLIQGRSRLAPLWRAFSDLLGPMIVVLFNTPVSPDRVQHAIPALERARRLWDEPSRA